MNYDTPSVRRGLTFGVATGLFGGSIWTIMFFVFSDEHGRDLWREVGLIGFGAFVVWFLVGFVVGAMTGSTARKNAEPADENRLQRPWILTLLTAGGRFLYRAIVGFCAGFIVTATFTVVVIGIEVIVGGDLIVMLKKLLDMPSAGVLLFAWMASTYGGMVGGIIAGILGNEPVKAPKHGIGRRAIVGSTLGMFLGAKDGAICGLVASSEIHQVTVILSGLFAGVLAGILASMLSELRSLKQRIALEEK